MSLNSFLERKVNYYFPNFILDYYQELLLKSGIFINSGEFFVLFLCSAFLISLFSLMISIYFSFFNILFLISIILIEYLFVLAIFTAYLLFKIQRRFDIIEESLPDFFRQLSSLLRVGFGLESAIEDIAKNGSGPLNDELKRMIIEIKMGKSFDDAFSSLTDRINSKNTFNIILESRYGGASVADILEDISNDLRTLNIIKKERKSAVSMSISFLLLSSIFAAPFSLAMVNVYTEFINDLGKNSAIIGSISFASQSYLIIHSILVGLIIARVLYADEKKGIKFSIIITVLSFIVFKVVNLIINSLFII